MVFIIITVLSYKLKIVIEAGGIIFGEAGGIIIDETGGIIIDERIIIGKAGGIIIDEAGGIIIGETGGIIIGETGGIVIPPTSKIIDVTKTFLDRVFQRNVLANLFNYFFLWYLFITFFIIVNICYFFPLILLGFSV